MICPIQVLPNQLAMTDLCSRMITNWAKVEIEAGIFTGLTIPLLVITRCLLDRLPNIQLTTAPPWRLVRIQTAGRQKYIHTLVQLSLSKSHSRSLKAIYNSFRCPSHLLKGLKTGLIRYLAFLGPRLFWHQSYHHLHRPAINLVQAYGEKGQGHLRHRGLVPQSDGERKVVIQVRGPRLHRYLSQSYAQLPPPHRGRAARHEIYLKNIGD